MMDLNLLPSEAKFQAAKIKLKKRINTFMWLFSGFWLILVMVIFIVWFWRKANLNSNEKTYQKTLKNYQSMVGNVVISQQIKFQAKLVGKLLSDRFEYGSAVKKVMQLFSTDVTINDFEIQEGRRFTIKGTVLGENLDEVEKKSGEINGGKVENFSSARVTSLVISPDGICKFSMEVGLK
jgi:hypothetical protein